jgi:subtilisin
MPRRKALGYVIASSLLILLFSNLILSGLSSLSISLSKAYAQSDNNKGSNRGNSDERLSQAQDNAKKLRQAAGERIPNHYIVVLKDRINTPAPLSSFSSSSSVADSVRASAEKARSEGAVLRHLYEHAIRGFAIRVPNDKVLDSILKNPDVDYVQPDVKVKAFSQTLPRGIDRVDADLSATKSGDGTGTVDADIAVLDTGIDLSHPDLNVYRQTTFVSGTSSGNDDDGHGTHVAGIAAAKDDGAGVVGIAPSARLWAVKVLDSNGDGFDSDIIAGIDYITQHANEIDVVNMSFGGDGPDNALHTAIINSVNAGVTYTAAAGNEASDAASVVPASFPEVIAVSAISDSDGKCGGLGGSSDDKLASFSNYGSVVDMAAPGVNIFSTYKGSTYATMSGTSMATPHVTGAAALYKSIHPGAAPSEIKSALLSSGSTPSTVCDGKGHGYFTGDHDSIAEPLLYLASSTSSSTDTTPPTVTTTTPGSGATGVAVTSSVTATFSEAVQSATVTTSTFTLKNSAGTSITGTVSLSSNVATFKPSSNLAYSTSYTAAVTNGIKDLAGNLLTPKSWSFTTAAAPPPPTSSCDNNLAISTAISSPSQSTFSPTNAIDNNLNTKWWSTFIVNPWIRVDLGSQHAICSVNIAWADGTSRQYSFTISVSTDGSSFTNVFSGKSSGTSTSSEKYTFAESQARYVKITVTQSHVGSASSIAQISEIDVFGKTGTSSTSSHSSSQSQSYSTVNKARTSNENSAISNHPPIAKADRISTERNTQVLIPILSNDIDPDGNDLKVISASSHSKNGGTIRINSNGTITFLPSVDFVGSDSFSYTISDGKGKSDKAKVSIIVKSIQGGDPIDNKTNKQIKATKTQQNPTQEEKLQLENRLVKNELNQVIPESTQNVDANNNTVVGNR